MENYEILLAIDNVLSVKSSAVLRSVSKITREYITLKKYSFYKIFKQLKTTEDLIIIMLFKSDPSFLSIETDYYYSIEYHKYGKGIKEYVINSTFYQCVKDFIQANFEYQYYDYQIVELIKEHCEMYSIYKPLLSLLIQLCYEEYTLIKNPIY